MEYQVIFHYEGIPEALGDLCASIYVTMRNRACEISSEMLGKINEEWDKTGKPAAFGRYAEDVNPEYIQFIRDRMQPVIDKTVNKESGILRIVINDVGDFDGEIIGMKNSKIYVTLKPID